MTMHIPVLPPIAVVDMSGEPLLNERDEQVTMTFGDFVLGYITDPIFAASLEALGICAEIRQQALRCKHEQLDVMELPDGHWSLLKQAITKPTQTPNQPAPLLRQAAFAWNFLPFMHAIVDKATREPVAVASKTDPISG